MKITTLIEDSFGKNKDLANEHGLSFFIETIKGNILFDTGKSDKIIDNSKKLDINLHTTKSLILSHSHYDHCGGVKNLLDTFEFKPELYIHKNFFKNANRYHRLNNNKNHTDLRAYKYIGIDFDESYIRSKEININYVGCSMTKIIDNIYVFANFQRNCLFEDLNERMMIKNEEEQYVIDSFDDEIVVGLDTEKGLIILLGCSHPGVINILNTISKVTLKKIYGIFGGTHLIEADEQRIIKTINKLKEMEIKLIGVSHCTGDRAIDLFSRSYSNFFINNTGSVIYI
ncbi:MBL fold metallo-hydrolase [Clostridium rectalis]|uniref:MBL fold metallo-hydrolase n=1 Tax=Clostridium rectalis TaxID=2040295 RepID=UPI000F63CBFA|nr:MBL fold metallo-hydrolase [Clostridium rectalis]